MLSKRSVLLSCFSSFLFAALSAATTAEISNAQVQDTIPQSSVPAFDELALPSAVETSDSLAAGTDTTKKARPMFEAEIQYGAKDSVIFDRGKVHLYGDARVSYLDVELKAYYIELDIDSTLAFAEGYIDENGEEKGLPVFKDKSGEYTMRRMKYNFETEKAIIEHVVTTQGEGYVVSEWAKKNDDNSYFLKDGRYTTCDHHDHPHFYINMTKAKVIPGNKIVTGPAYLVVEDVKIFPLFIPFAFVPSTSSYSSGILMPSYGEESNRGFFLRDGGYYWAAGQYFDLSLTGDIYANGSWGLRTASNYRKRYKYSGAFNLQTITNVTSEKDLPDYSKSKDFSITWSHRQDAKANPNSSLSASVNYSTSSFDRNNVGSIINPEILAQNQKRSSISYTKRFPGSPFNLSVNLLHSQNSRDTSINLTIPDFTLTMSRIYPFKSKNKIATKERWYETVSISYTGTFKNEVKTHERDLSFTAKSLSNDWRNGAKHSIPVSMNLKLLKYFTLTPSFNYTERWYLKSIRKSWDEEAQKVVVTDTVGGFQRAYDYSFGVGTSTKIYTYYRPIRALFGDKINVIRHVMTPSVSVGYTPNFTDPKYGYFDHLEYYDVRSDRIVKQDYSIYEGSIYGYPSSRESGSIGFNLGNTLEMKLKSDRDSTGFKKVAILEALNFSTSYNMLADEFALSRINMNGRTKIFGTNISFGAVFDPYALDSVQVSPTTKSVQRINSFEWSANNRLARLETANLSFGFNFGADTFKKKKSDDAGNQSDDQSNQLPEANPLDDPDALEEAVLPVLDVEPLEEGDEGYAKFEMPWNISVNYNMRVIPNTAKFDPVARKFDYKFTADVSLSGNVSLTKKWSINMSTGYNLERKEISHTNLSISRNLHCWNMNFNMVPFGAYKSFFFSIAINSTMLRDLKYEKRSHPRDNPNWF